MKKMQGIKGIIVFILPFVALLAANAARLNAQGSNDAVRAGDAIQKTEEVIAQARTVVDESRSQKARLSLQVAVGIQERAQQSYRSHGYGSALKLTTQAREEAWHAIALARSDAQFEQNNGRVGEETHERLTRLRDLMIESGVRDEQAMKLMEQSRNLLEKSRLNAQQLRYQLALKLANNAQQLALRAEEHIRNTRALKDASERRLALLERLIERAREQVQERDQELSRTRLRIAEEQIDKARELLNAGRYREAKQALERCEKTLRNSVRLIPSRPAGDPQDRLEEAYRLLERSVEIVADKGEAADPKTLQVMEQSREMLRRAGDAIGGGRVAEGMSLIARAREMLRVAIRTHSGEMSREALMLRIERIEALRVEALNIAETCSAPGIKELMERSQAHLRLAREHAERGNLESAAAEAAIARNLCRRISEICAR